MKRSSTASIQKILLGSPSSQSKWYDRIAKAELPSSHQPRLVAMDFDYTLINSNFGRNPSDIAFTKSIMNNKSPELPFEYYNLTPTEILEQLRLLDKDLLFIVSHNAMPTMVIHQLLNKRCAASNHKPYFPIKHIFNFRQHNGTQQEQESWVLKFRKNVHLAMVFLTYLEQLTQLGSQHTGISTYEWRRNAGHRFLYLFDKPAVRLEADQAIFNLFIKIRSSIILFDDIKENCEAAEELGITTYHVKNFNTATLLKSFIQSHSVSVATTASTVDTSNEEQPHPEEKENVNPVEEATIVRVGDKKIRLNPEDIKWDVDSFLSSGP